MASDKETVPEPSKENIQNALEPLSKAVKSTVGALWKIFVMHYVARGVSEMVVVGITAWLTIDKLWANYWIWWLCIPFPIMMILLLDSIKLLINPHYYAMGDIVERIKQERSGGESAISIFTDGKKVS